MRLLLILLLIFLTKGLFAQRYSFVEYSTEEGLPQTQVKSIAQDKDGYLWVGTLGGLAKFNGKEFSSYTRDQGLANNKIISIQLIKNTIWVGHEGGISKYSDNAFKSWILPDDLKNIQVTQIIDFKGEIIVGTNGAGLFKLTSEGLKSIPFEAKSSDRIRDLIQFENKYFVGTRDGVYYTSDFEKFHFIKETDEWSVSDLELYQNKICITTFQDGIHLYNPESKSIKPIKVDPEINLASTFADKNGNLWIAAAEGILSYKEGKMKFINDKKGIPLVAINRVFEDDEGNIWVGSDGKGLICFSGEKFVHHNQSTGLPSDLIIDVNQDKNGQYWISTFNKGLVLQKKNGEFINVYDNILRFWCSAMQVEGMNWFGTEEGLLAFDQTQLQKTYRYSDSLGLLGDKITALFKISNTKMYVGGPAGLTLYSNGKFKSMHDNDNSDIGTIRDIEMFNGQIYLATDKGFFTYKNNKVISIKGFSKTTFSLQKDDFGSIWLGTEEGLYQFIKGEIVNRGFSNEPASMFINFLNYKNKRLYIGTNNGLYSYLTSAKNEHPKIEHFGIQEGVINLETNINSSFFDKQGRLWFGTASGLVIFNAKTNQNEDHSPRLLMTELLLNYQKTDFSKEEMEDLSFHYTKNNISFNFDGISFSNPKELRYQYWLEGSSDDWSPPTSSSTANYTGLRAGEYVLHARAVGPQKTMSKEIRIPFEIRPPYYQTWWFILISILILGYLIYRFVRFRLQREREIAEKEKIVIQNKLLGLEQQSLNASMNRHFIFNSLNSIQYFINTQDRVSANKYLTNFAQLIRKNLDSSTSEGNTVPLSKEIERLKLYLGLESMRFNDKFEYTFEINVPEAETLLIPSMLLQPFIENSIVHGVLPNKNAQGKIKTKAWVEDDILFITIEDNGIGISQSLKTKHDFNGDHRSQGMEITAKRISLIKQISNKGFEIIGPQDIIGENRSINGTYVLLKIPFEDLEN